LDRGYRVIDLDKLIGGNVLVGPEIQGEVGTRSKEIMIGFNKAEHPWESELHIHEASKEFYIILKGGLTLRVGEESVEMGSHQMLVVDEGVPHTIEEYNLPIEFFTIRAPAIEDKVVIEE